MSSLYVLNHNRWQKNLADLTEISGKSKPHQILVCLKTTTKLTIVALKVCQNHYLAMAIKIFSLFYQGLFISGMSSGSV